MNTSTASTDEVLYSDDLEPTRQAGKRKRVDREYLSRLPVSHLIRHFLLFAVTVMFLLTLARAGYILWKINEVGTVGEMISSFLMGVRFDLALVGMMLAIPVLLVPLLAMFSVTRRVAKFVSIVWMVLALALVLALELLTPYTLHQQGLRPDMAVFGAMGDPVSLLSQLWSKYIIPAIVGLVLTVLIFWAFIARLDSKRFLRHPVRVVPAICLSLIGCALCVLAAKGSVDPLGLSFGVDNARVSQASVVNEITANSAFKTAESVFPF